MTTVIVASSSLSAALAQTPAPASPPRDVVAEVAAVEKIAGVQLVVSPNARAAVVCDAANVLVIGNRASKDAKPGTLSVFKLDAQGNTPAHVPAKAAVPAVAAVAAVPAIAATPTTPAVPEKPAIPAKAAEPAVPAQPGEHADILLPRPASLEKALNYTLSLAVHPKLPILYVWQDIATIPVPDPKNNPYHTEFDHLLVYNLAGGIPQLLGAFARGEEHAYSNLAGTMAIDAAGKRLYVPNLRVPGATPAAPRVSGIGWFELDDRGVPVLKDGKATPRMEDVSGVCSYPNALGIVPASDDAILIGSSNGPCTLDMANRRARYGLFYMNFSAVNTFRVSGHPKLPMIFIHAIGAGSLYRMDQADGYLSGIPQRLQVGGTTFQSMPVVMTKPNKVAIGMDHRLHVIDLDAKGYFTGKAQMLTTIGVGMEAIAYSEKFDRLYSAVDDVPPPAPAEKKP